MCLISYSTKAERSSSIYLLIAAEFWLAPHRHGQLTGLFTASAQDPFEIHIYEYELLDWRQYGLRWKRKTFSPSLEYYGQIEQRDRLTG